MVLANEGRSRILIYFTLLLVGFGTNRSFQFVQQTSAVTFTVDPKFGTPCDATVQCGTNGLICIDQACDYCISDSECASQLETVYQCKTNSINSTMVYQYINQTGIDKTRLFNSSGLNFGICVHKPLISPFSWRDFLALFICFIGSCIAAGAGVGGGALNVAILVFIAQFNASTAVPLSSIMILGAAVANFMHALQKKRQTADRPLIDYHSALLLQPLTMGGSVIGFLLNRVFPDWLTLLILLVVLGYTLYTTLGKFIKAWQKDHEANSGRTTVQAISNGSTEQQTNPIHELSLIHADPSSTSSSSGDVDQKGTHPAKTKEAGNEQNVALDSPQQPTESGQNDVPTELNFDENDAKDVRTADQQKAMELEMLETKIPIKKLLFTFGILLFVTIHSILIGGKSGPSLVGIVTCSWEYWLVLSLLFPVLGVVSLFIARWMVQDYHLKRSVNFEFKDSDIQWTEKRVWVTFIVAFGAGIVATMLGIGGGMIINPLLLTLGVAPDCTAATSSLMILFTAFSATAQYGLIGRIQWDYALVLLVLGIVGSLVGQHALGLIVKKYKSQSYIILAMLFIMVPGGILLTISAAQGIASDVKTGAGFGFKNFCK